MLDVAQVDPLRRALQQDLAAVFDQRQRGEEDHERDAQPDGRIGVETPRRRGKPDDDGGDDDAYVVDGVAEHMQQGTLHAQVPTRHLD